LCISVVCIVLPLAAFLAIVFSYGITADVAALVAAGLAPEALLAVTDTVSVFPASPATGV
jgi:hypothetical protein